jgi:hypothetical protein
VAQVYYQTQPMTKGHNYGWIYGPAVTLDAENCGTVLRAALVGELYGGLGVDVPVEEAVESEPVG